MSAGLKPVVRQLASNLCLYDTRTRVRTPNCPSVLVINDDSWVSVAAVVGSLQWLLYENQSFFSTRTLPGVQAMILIWGLNINTLPLLKSIGAGLVWCMRVSLDWQTTHLWCNTNVLICYWTNSTATFHCSRWLNTIDWHIDQL